eukprot:CAMPEP_0181225034 /NCGR_PEP_ID=MMETSP1096-20121128/31466_1 /TAXON_ID=156174 ORGANISM="Chrysochromulina ericina, Strain CCMP281" /NCGR_SAMPLE_ID=MMETSP1096 /ASSEMBLY_ACC=CAM_ASM_000453 /LENGTH=45 /DNA_ID= /DNA_START= /DNA_END= /DNA_ORIENTATION=
MTVRAHICSAKALWASARSASTRTERTPAGISSTHLKVGRAARAG